LNVLLKQFVHEYIFIKPLNESNATIWRLIIIAQNESKQIWGP